MFSRSTFAFFLLLGLLLSACSEYNRVMKSDDLDYKFEMAQQYYEDEAYLKALPLLEELISLYRGTNRNEKIYYYYCQSHYGIGDFYLAGYYFNNFVKTYPNSEYAEECAFMSALCHYKNSPIFSLDQTDTHTALNEFQRFLNRFPSTAKKDTCHVLMGKLRDKLERKTFYIAQQYYKTEQYKSAIVALNNALKEFPNTQFKEEIHYLIFMSSYSLAINSITSKKEERLEDAIEAYFGYVDKFSDSARIRELETLYTIAINELEQLKSIN